MPQRETQILEPTPDLSSAFGIGQCYYDKPGAAKFLLGANVTRLGRLEECHQLVSRLLSDPSSRDDIRDKAEHDDTFGDLGHAVLHEAFRRAVREMLDQNTERVRRALQCNTSSPPEEHERVFAADLYGVPRSASWRDIAAGREAYQFTELMLGYAALPPDEREPLTIRQALAEIAAGRVSVLQSEHAETFRKWGGAVLSHMPHAAACVG